MTINSLDLQSDVVFHASYPDYLKDSLIKKVISFVYDVFSVLIFPIGICRFIAYKMHINLGYYFLIPSQFLSKKNIKYLDEGRKNLINNFDAREITIETADNVKLDGIFIPGKNILGRKLKEDGPLIIHYLANAGRYEDLGHRQEAIKSLRNHNILVVNFRGVSRSESISTSLGLLLDSEAIFEYALKILKVPENKIIVHGHSMGGRFATWIASNHEKVSLLNDRSFGSLSATIYYVALNLFQNLFSYLIIIPFILLKKIMPRKVVEKVSDFVKHNKIFENDKILRPHFLVKIIYVISKITALFLSNLAVFFGWDYKPYLEWDKVKGKKMIVFLKNDGLIAHRASFFKGVKKYPDQFICITNPKIIHSSILDKATLARAIEYLSS